MTDLDDATQTWSDNSTPAADSSVDAPSYSA